MVRTLRGQLVLSHILPILLIVPLVGVALVYILETQILLAGLSHDLVRQGEQTANLASNQPQIWSDTVEAERFVTGFRVRTESHVMLVDPYGNVLASSRPGDIPLGEPIDLPFLQEALAGQQHVQVNYVQSLEAEVVQVLVPVLGPNQIVMGVVSLSQQLSDVQGQFTRLRRLIAIVLVVELLLGVLLGLALALRLGRSLQRVTGAIDGVATGQKWGALPEEGPQEIQTLLRAFNTLIDRLRLLEESRRRLLANLVHELGRPLGALQSALQALLSGAEQDPDLRHELLEGMDAQVRRLRPLVENLADLHGQVLGTLELNRQHVALGDWLRRAVVPWRQAAHEQGLTWQMDIPDSLPVVDIDPDRLAQVIGNLLSNAIKYTPKGTVAVDAAVAEDSVAIVVRDTGIGISHDEQTRIFEPFYRSRRDTRFPQGMGLGLSIARDLVVAHGGRLEVDSTPGRGSRFTIWLPQASDQQTPSRD
jgi:two-component system sensor histidine kinase BaeS